MNRVERRSEKSKRACSSIRDFRVGSIHIWRQMFWGHFWPTYLLTLIRYIYLNLLNSCILRKLCVLYGKIFHIFQKLQWRMFTNCKICILFWYESNKPSLFKIQSSPSKNRKGFFDKTTIVQFKKTIWRVINHTQLKPRAEIYYPVCIWTFVGVFLHLYFYINSKKQ